MTLDSFDPDQLDHLTLRVLDLCARMRAMAERSRKEEISTLPLHARKAREWLAQLEEWAHKSEANLDREIRKSQGARSATRKMAE